jgi:hypothetical protein
MIVRLKKEKKRRKHWARRRMCGKPLLAHQSPLKMQIQNLRLGFVVMKQWRVGADVEEKVALVFHLMIGLFIVQEVIRSNQYWS